MNQRDPWSKELVRQAVARNLVIIVGAGISASSTNSKGDRPAGWATLLGKLVDELGLSRRASEIKALISADRLLDAAELLKKTAREESKLQDVHQIIRSSVDGDENKLFQGSVWHETLMRLEPSIIVTTNYDRIIERASGSAYNTHDFRSTALGGDVRRRLPVLIKIHGSLDRVEDIILTRTDYGRIRSKGAHAMEVLQALLMTRPALLLGYRLQDPDIQLLLENVFGGRGGTPAHYMLTSDATPDYEQEVMRVSYGVTPILYPDGEYSTALKMLNDLADRVENSSPTL